jgi:hypothetical protein
MLGSENQERFQLERLRILKRSEVEEEEEEEEGEENLEMAFWNLIQKNCAKILT